MDIYFQEILQLCVYKSIQGFISHFIMNKKMKWYYYLYRSDAISNGRRNETRTNAKRVRSWEKRSNQLSYAVVSSIKNLYHFSNNVRIIRVQVQSIIISSLWYFHYRDSENDKAIEDVLESKGKHQSELINGLLEDEKYQREAFKTMFLAQDARSKEIASQVESIQAELTSLSMVEMTKTNLKVQYLIWSNF